MTPEQWRRARELFERAVDMPSGDVSAWLLREEPDPVIAGEVQSLLMHHTGAGSFLSAAISDRVSGLLDDEPVYAAGDLVGEYEVEREIGRGGMGRVYLARDRRLGRRVALKVLAPHLVGDAVQRERLRNEARAAASLSHPGICTIYALEETDGIVAIAAEYIEGHSLREEMAGGRRLAARDLLELARELSAALAAAHARGITHRDLKPENIVRASNGRLKILDFGLALVEPGGDLESPRATSPGMVVGTPLYMAPEQLDGGRVDVRTDVFALGVLLYERAAGAHPFESRSGMALAARILESEPPPLAAVRDDLPAHLVRVIERCLRKRPDARFASAGDVLLALASDDVRPAAAGGASWWRVHMVVVLALYLVAVLAGWQMKEWSPGLTQAGFIALAIGAAIGGILRGHLLFAEHMHTRGIFLSELGRVAAPLIAVDLALSAVLLGEALWTARTRPVPGVLIAALAVGIALAKLVLERSTTDVAFNEGQAGQAGQ